MTSENLKDDVGTGLKCRTFAMHLKFNTKVLHSGRALSDYGTSMQNLSDRNLTMCGGNKIIFGCQPICSSSSRYGSHQRLSVLILTPALLASSCFVIAFILNLGFNLNSYIIHLTSCILQHLLTCTYRKNSSARNFHVRTREEIVRFSVSVRHRVP